MRGGFRGRGRGRGVGGGAEPRAMQLIPGMAKVDHRAVTAGTLKYGGVLYPTSVLSTPSDLEEDALKYALELEKILQEGLPGISDESATPWRIPDTRKVVGIEIETYSDRNRPTSSGPSKLDPALLHLDERFFPPSLWKLYFEGKGPGSKAMSKEDLERKRKRALDDLDGEGEKDDPDKSDAGSSVEDDFDFDDDQSDHQDYDANYFDNGEGDDDEGGDEGESERSERERSECA